ncbi:MAG: hypothetical protein MI741_23565 [Rhodospirillales bacterium]|nr:hypothetical protein [Rhodospirillales bacterium]
MTENEIQIDRLLQNMVSACTSAAVDLHEQMRRAPADMPQQYVIPRMRVELKMQMSYSEGRVKGFFSKNKTESEASSMSLIELDIVSVPRLPTNEE